MKRRTVGTCREVFFGRRSSQASCAPAARLDRRSLKKSEARNTKTRTSTGNRYLPGGTGTMETTYWQSNVEQWPQCRKKVGSLLQKPDVPRCTVTVHRECRFLRLLSLHITVRTSFTLWQRFSTTLSSRFRRPFDTFYHVSR